MGSALGHDGFPKEFYAAFWSDMRELTLDAVHATWLGKSMGAFFNTGLICLCPKGGDPRQLRQWRPIAVLSTFYKLISKSLALRMQPHMAGWLEEE